MADIVADAVMQSIMTSPLERAGGEVVGSQSSRSLQDGDGDEHKTLSKQFSYSKVWRNSYGPKLSLGEESEGEYLIALKFLLYFQKHLTNSVTHYIRRARFPYIPSDPLPHIQYPDPLPLSGPGFFHLPSHRSHPFR